MLLSNYILFILGIVIVIVALFLIKKDLMVNSRNVDFFNKKEDEFIKNIEVADDIIQELNDIGEKIINRIDEKIIKINELLEKVEDSIKTGESFNFDTQRREHENFIEEKSYNYVEENTNSENDSSSQGGQELKKIFELSSSGQTPSEIAKLLNKGIGEINLILNIKKR